MEEFENLIVEKLMSTERDGMKDLIAAMMDFLRLRVRVLTIWQKRAV